VHFRFVWVGRTKDPHLAELEERYLKRLGHFLPTERIWVPELKKNSRSQAGARLSREARSIEQKVKDTYLIVLDESGRQLSSRELSSLLEELMNRSEPVVSFVVGGYGGIPEQIKQPARLKWSLGKLTLPHELARVVVLEQVYRSMSMIRSLPYHK